MPIVNVYGERRTREVMIDTWGHMAPTPGQPYTGFMLFSVSAYGNEASLIQNDFGELDGGPWLFADMHDYINVWSRARREPGVYLWTGTYRVASTPKVYGDQHWKPGRFSGRIRQLVNAEGGIRS